jgi:hypothetical protein
MVHYAVQNNNVSVDVQIVVTNQASSYLPDIQQHAKELQDSIEQLPEIAQANIYLDLSSTSKINPILESSKLNDDDNVALNNSIIHTSVRNKDEQEQQIPWWSQRLFVACVGILLLERHSSVPTSGWSLRR